MKSPVVFQIPGTKKHKIFCAWPCVALKEEEQRVESVTKFSVICGTCHVRCHPCSWHWVTLSNNVCLGLMVSL